MKWGKVEFDDWERLERNLSKIAAIDFDKFCRDVAKELAARLIRNLIKTTPVDTGTLRRGWTGGVDANAAAYANGLKVHRLGDTYQILIMNPEKYGAYVNYGHRTRDHKGFVEGYHFLEVSVDAVQRGADKVIEKKLRKLLEDAFR
ncbi:MAG: HK97 gp10 family phage protein [Clostridiales Family XIII bacterium]|jgi:hypothetical protein|nr:HK97 gp10 family phage protein [Clostridiales Family XIII bacterium]